MASSNESTIDGGISPLYEFRLRKPPFWLVSLLIIAATATLLPLALIARARFNTSEQPRIHLVQDMGNQPKHIPQTASVVFADRRAARPEIDGTVERNAVVDDPHYTQGYTQDGAGKVTFFKGYPSRVKIDSAFLARGQRQFNIYCSTCHGLGGQGDGMIHVRAAELQAAGGDISRGTSWTQPANIQDQTRRERPEGHLFNTITNGIRNMGGLGHQISVEDRWAIVAYIRALQASGTYPSNKLDPQVRDALK